MGQILHTRIKLQVSKFSYLLKLQGSFFSTCRRTPHMYMILVKKKAAKLLLNLKRYLNWLSSNLVLRVLLKVGAKYKSPERNKIAFSQ